jgi:hypothetical protein
MDWDTLLRMAKEHGTLPLLNRFFGRCGIDEVPKPFLDQLRQGGHDHARRNLMLLQCLLKLIAMMRRAGVRVLPYKGPVLALTAYGDASMRQCSDLDLIAPEADLPAAQAVLEAAGFRKVHAPEIAADPSHASVHEYHLTYENVDHSIVIELHWEVVGQLFSVQLDPVDLWHRSQARQLAGMKINVLSAEDELLVLCIHGTKHYWTRLTWICDIAQCLKGNPTIDWKLLIDRAAKQDARGMLIIAILLAHEVLGVAVPPSILAEAKAAHHAGARELSERLFCEQSSPHATVRGSSMQLNNGGLFASLMFHARTRDRWSSAARYCFHRAFTPNAVDLGHTKLPRPLRFMYYVIRPLRLLAKYGPWTRSSGDSTAVPAPQST